MNQGVFHRLFPPPEFLTMPATGVDISDESVHLAQIGFTSSGKRVGKYKRFPLEQGIVEEGEIKDVAKLREVFRNIKKESGIHHVNVSLPEQLGYVVMLRIPKIPRKNIRSTIELQLEEHVPLAVSEVVFGYDIVKGLNDDSVDYYDLNLSVYPRKIIDQYVELFTAIDVIPLRFENEAHSVKRAVVEEGNQETTMIVDFGKTRTGFTIVSGGAVRFTSTINLGGDTLTRAIARSMDISFADAEQLKREKGLVIGNGEDENLAIAQMPTVSALKDEVNKYMSYWSTHAEGVLKKQRKMDKIIICGGLANFKGFAEYLGSNLTVSVETGNVFTNVGSFENYIPDIPFNESLQYATAIGLALSIH